MEPIEYLRALRRRWPVVVLAVVLAVAVAWLTTTVVPLGVSTREYQATTVLFDIGTAGGAGTTAGGNPSLNTVAALTTIKPVADLVAEETGYAGDPEDLIGRVRAAADPEAGLIRITARSPNEQEAVLLADSFTNSLLRFLAERKSATLRRESEYYEAELDRLVAEIEALDALIDGTSGTQKTLLEQRRNAELFTHSSLEQQYRSLISTASERQNLQIIQDATARPVTYQGFQPPQSGPSRMILAGILGLLAGAGIALLLERIDTRIRTKKDAERTFKLPVLSEIPASSPRERQAGAIATAARPASPEADAFRLLGESVIRLPGLNGNGAGPAPGHPGAQRSPAILVTSPGPREGKSTVVANLAAALSEVGKRVMVLSCDFRSPGVHHMFGVGNPQGLADALRNGGNADGILNGHIKETSLRKVRVVTSGAPPSRPSGLLSSDAMRRALDEAREEADVVLLDTPALLTASDAAHLVDEVDAVLVVSRVGKTTTEQAQRAADLLTRLEAPVVGVALTGTADTRPRGSRWSFNRSA
jgi:capsular exopolysaccharide synthesis family protein